MKTLLFSILYCTRMVGKGGEAGTGQGLGVGVREAGTGQGLGVGVGEAGTGQGLGVGVGEAGTGEGLGVGVGAARRRSAATRLTARRSFPCLKLEAWQQAALLGNSNIAGSHTGMERPPFHRARPSSPDRPARSTPSPPPTPRARPRR
jgi:hypothetical protein